MASVKDAVKSREKENVLEYRTELMRWIGIAVGSLIFAFGINMFLRPLHLYSGGIMGFAQLFTNLLHDKLGIRTGNVDLSGILYYLMNVPGMVIAYLKMPRRFFWKTIFAVTCITVLLTLIPIASEPILEEKIANCLIAGVLAGVGVS